MIREWLTQREGLRRRRSLGGLPSACAPVDIARKAVASCEFARETDRPVSATPRNRRRAVAGIARRGSVAVEAALVLPVLVTFMLGMWEVARLTQVQQILESAAREGARLAAGGIVDGKPVTAPMVELAVRDYLRGADLPDGAVDGAQITLLNRSSNAWTDPSDAQPLDAFEITLVIPAGNAFNSLRLTAAQITGLNHLSAKVDWASLNDSKLVVDTQLPY